MSRWDKGWQAARDAFLFYPDGICVQSQWKFLCTHRALGKGGAACSGFSAAEDLVEHTLDVAKVALVNLLAVLETVAKYGRS
jgi:hypothetical protein